MEHSSKWNTHIIKKGTHTHHGMKTLISLKNIFNHITVSFSWTQGSPPPLNLDFGLCARVFSAVFLPLEPAIEFSHSPAVSPSKSRDFRLPEPTIPFYHWSAVSPSKSRDFRWARDPFLLLVSGFPVTSGEPTIPFYYWSAVSPPSRDFWRHSTNQKPVWGPYERPLLLCWLVMTSRLNLESRK